MNTIKARVNHGRWIADCPVCRGAEVVYPDREFVCRGVIARGYHPRPGIVNSLSFKMALNLRMRTPEWQPCIFKAVVEFPKNKRAIETALMRRPHADWRNWDWGWSLLDLINGEPFLHFSWTTPRTWTTGELVTASILNTHVRDNFNETAPAKVTTAGDTIYATGANALTRLALGALGTHWRAGASAPAWSNIGVPLPIRKSADESVTSSTTLQNDDEFLQAINANESWLVIISLYMTNSNAGGVKCTITAPAAATFSSIGIGGFTGAASSVQQQTAGSNIFGTNGGGGNPFEGLILASILNSVNAGNINFQFAQFSSDGTATVNKAGSLFIPIRLS